MELDSKAFKRAIILTGLSATLAACSVFGGGGDLAGADPAFEKTAQSASTANGPHADYPQVLGAAFTVDGQEFVPVDTASYDAVGYASLDTEGGQGITLAHKTLPLPSYVEVTALDTGRTMLARVERRGPMTGSRLIALSPGAQALLGVDEGASVRVRRVNPPEADRMELRAGRKAADRIDTPKSLLGVLQRKLPVGGAGFAPVRSAQAVPESGPAVPPALATVPPKTTAQITSSANGAAPVPAARTASAGYPLGGAIAGAAKPPLPQVAGARPPIVPAAAPEATPVATPATQKATLAPGDFVVQAAAFSSKANADRAAGKIGGFVTKVGAIYRVRTGPYSNRGQAEAALAKVRAAGYSDAHVSTAG